MKDYFELQYVLINREIKATGLNPFIVYGLGVVVFFMLSEYIFKKTEFANYILILTSLSFQFKLSEKNRSDFLKSTFGDKRKRKIRVLENVIICLPFVSFLVYKNYFIEACFLFLSSMVLALFSFQVNFNLTIPTPFSQRPFEFSTGFRKSFFMFPIAYVLTMVAITVDNLNLGIFSFLLLFLTVFSYYHKPEKEYFVWVHAETPKAFLMKKLVNASINITFITIPILSSLLVFYPSEFELISLFFLIGLLFLWAVILGKYSVYPREMNLSEGILIAFCVYLPPLLLLVIPFFYAKSIKQLKQLLND